MKGQTAPVIGSTVSSICPQTGTGSVDGVILECGTGGGVGVSAVWECGSVVVMVVLPCFILERTPHALTAATHSANTLPPHADFAITLTLCHPVDHHLNTQTPLSLDQSPATPS